MIDEALLRVLSAHTGRREAFADPPVALVGGHWAAIYGFELSDPPPDLIGPLVLRVMPDRDTGLRETIVQRAVADQGYPTPRVVLAGFDDDVGGAFMVMERVPGVAPLDGLGLGRILPRLPATLRRVSQQLSSATLALHGLDPQPIIGALERAGIDIAQLGVAARLAEISAAAQSSFSGFEELLAWLNRHTPRLTPSVVSHGDIHPFNMLVNADGSFNVLDWTNANVCRREYDIGFTAALLQCAPIAVPRIGERALRAITGSLARRFIDAYRRTEPINLDVVEWFETLQYARCLAAVVMAPMAADGIVGPRHPFRISAPAMVRQVRMITGVRIELPAA
jgi:aminoglycoside phosphotransferase (APT) family kinase protein